MAFVYRCQHDLYVPSSTPGPGQYRAQSQVRQQKLVSAPFNQSSPRKIWEKNVIPGPGTYATHQLSEQRKTFIQNCGQSYAVFQAPIETSIFKSNSKRFKDIQQKSPGPGQYVIDTEKIKKEKKISLVNNLQKYLQKSSKDDKVQKELSIGTILEEECKGSQVKQRSPVNKVQKKTVPFNSKVERSSKIRPKTSLGPGSYDVTKNNQKEEFHRKSASQSIAKFKRIMPTEYLKPSVPDAVEVETSSAVAAPKKSFNQRKQDFFGSTVKRFKKVERLDLPGPGNYDITLSKSTKSQSNKKKLAFGRSLNSNQSMRQIFLSPFRCQQMNDKDNHKKNQKASKVVNKNFGSKQPRFKQIKATSDSDESFPVRKQLYLGKENDEIESKFKKLNTRPVSKLHLERRNINHSSIKEPDWRPLCYAIDANTISENVKEKVQVNAPFMSQAARFTQHNHEKLLLEEIIAENQKNLCKENRVPSQSKATKGIMDSNNPRFVYKQVPWQLSPCSYNPSKLEKKEFNKLFL